jgi:hypothetical protein
MDRNVRTRSREHRAMVQAHRRRGVRIVAAKLEQGTARTFGDIKEGAQCSAITATGPLDPVVSRDPDFDGHIAPEH